VPEVNGGSYSVDWSVPTGVNRSPRTSGMTGQRVAQPVAAGPLGMEASLVEVYGQVTVTVRGEVDLATAGTLWEALRKATVPGNTLVVDLSGTLFMDSTGLDVLLRARRHLATIGSTILLRSPHERVLKLLEASGLDGVFPIEFVRGPNDNDLDLGEPGEREAQPSG
jgi:anti-sigma B factor antagonist